MKALLLAIPLSVALASAAETPLERMFDSKLTSAQRMDACFELRGDGSKSVAQAMLKALELDLLRPCAATNLRKAGGVDELKRALQHESPDVRSAAARELGSFQIPALLPALAKVAADPNLLVATNGLEGLTRYSGPEVFPYLETLAKKGGIVGILALDRLEVLKAPEALTIARQMLKSGEAPERVAAIRIIGESGDLADLPALREIARLKEPAMPQQRGFGLMPQIDLSRASQSSIAQIEKRSPAR